MANVLPPMNILAELESKKFNKIFFLILIVLGILSAVVAIQPESKNIKSYKENRSKIGQVIASVSPTPRATLILKHNLIKTSHNSPLPSPTVQPTPSSVSNLKESSPQPTSTPTSIGNQINVYINNGPSFTVSVNNGANQCDVLTKALQDGKISSLNMKYNNTYKTYGVYQINGIGKEDQIWWTYSVNGKNPPLGCSLVKANNNDNVVWIYTGSN